MDEQKKMFTNKSVTLFLVIVISVSAIFETIVIALRAMGLAVFLMWVRSVYKELHADHETGATDNK